MLVPTLEWSVLVLVGVCLSAVVWLVQLPRRKRSKVDPLPPEDEKKKIARLSYQLEALEFKNRTIQSRYSRLREISIEEDLNKELAEKLQTAVSAVKQGAQTHEIASSFEISDCEAELIEAVHGKLNRFSNDRLH